MLAPRLGARRQVNYLDVIKQMTVNQAHLNQLLQASAAEHVAKPSKPIEVIVLPTTDPSTLPRGAQPANSFDTPENIHELAKQREFIHHHDDVTIESVELVDRAWTHMIVVRDTSGEFRRMSFGLFAATPMYKLGNGTTVRGGRVTLRSRSPEDAKNILREHFKLPAHPRFTTMTTF